MKYSTNEIQIAVQTNASFPFLLEIAAETPTKKDVWFLLLLLCLLCSHCNLNEELKEVKGQKQDQEDYKYELLSKKKPSSPSSFLSPQRVRWKLPGRLLPSRPLQRRRSRSSWWRMACSSWWWRYSWWSPSPSSSASPLTLCRAITPGWIPRLPPISPAYLATYINVFLLFSIGLMFYKVLCCMFTYLYHRNSFLPNNAASVSFLDFLPGNRWRCISQCLISSIS